MNLRALKLLEPGGFLVTCSCSHHMSPDEFYAVVLDAALDARKHLRVVDTRGQAPDHPVLAGVPETVVPQVLHLPGDLKAASRLRPLRQEEPVFEQLRCPGRG